MLRIMFVRKELYNKWQADTAALTSDINCSLSECVKEHEKAWFNATTSKDWAPDRRPTLFAKIDSFVRSLLEGCDVLADESAVESTGTLTEDFFGGNEPTKQLVARMSRTGVALRLAKDMVTRHKHAIQRFWDLFAVMVEISPSTETTKFLRRVSRCYLYGFDVECAIMCRATLDAEFNYRIPSDDCITLLGSRKEVTLEDRVSTAWKMGRISDAGKTAAHKIRRIGNDLVHKDPDTPFVAIQCIEDTLLVIEELVHSDPHRAK